MYTEDTANIVDQGNNNSNQLPHTRMQEKSNHDFGGFRNDLRVQTVESGLSCPRASFTRTMLDITNSD